jgi:hypothetical protein
MGTFHRQVDLPLAHELPHFEFNRDVVSPVVTERGQVATDPHGRTGPQGADFLTQTGRLP